MELFLLSLLCFKQENIVSKVKNDFKIYMLPLKISMCPFAEVRI